MEEKVECPICENYNTDFLKEIPVENGVELEYCCYDCNITFAKAKYNISREV